jgi:hypothetical protein
MFIRLSRYVILGLIISLVAFLVTQNNKETIKKETLLLIGLISAVIIFAISFRIEFYENIAEPGEKQEPLVKQQKSDFIKGNTSNITDDATLIDQRAKLRKMAVEMIENMDKVGIEDDEELMKKVEEALRAELNKSKLPVGKMAEKIVDRVTNPKLEDIELEVQTQPKENRLSMQYEGAIEEVIKEKIREQLYSDEVIKRQKESDFTIMPVSEWSLPLERRKFKCIPRKEKEVCDCAPGQGTGFWEGSFMKIKGAPELPPQQKKLVDI